MIGFAFLRLTATLANSVGQMRNGRSTLRWLIPSIEGIHNMTKRLLIVLLLVLVAACGGAADSTTTGASAETTAAPTTTGAVAEEGGEDTGTDNTVSIADMPEECIDAFVQFLQAIEPVVADFDFENASVDEFEAMGTELETVGAEQEAEMESLNCPDTSGTDEETFAAMIDIAEREAPGAVPYFRWIEEFAGAFGEGGSTASGDCETDIGALEAVIADNETMGDMTMTEVAEVGALMTAITTECSAERVEEFFAQQEVETFLNSSG